MAAFVLISSYLDLKQNTGSIKIFYGDMWDKGTKYSTDMWGKVFKNEPKKICEK